MEQDTEPDTRVDANWVRYGPFWGGKLSELGLTHFPAKSETQTYDPFYLSLAVRDGFVFGPCFEVGLKGKPKEANNLIGSLILRHPYWFGQGPKKKRREFFERPSPASGQDR